MVVDNIYEICVVVLLVFIFIHVTPISDWLIKYIENLLAREIEAHLPIIVESRPVSSAATI